jgi:hypothetical protein
MSTRGQAQLFEAVNGGRGLAASPPHSTISPSLGSGALAARPTDQRDRSVRFLSGSPSLFPAIFLPFTPHIPTLFAPSKPPLQFDKYAGSLGKWGRVKEDGRGRDRESGIANRKTGRTCLLRPRPINVFQSFFVLFDNSIVCKARRDRRRHDVF